MQGSGTSFACHTLMWAHGKPIFQAQALRRVLLPLCNTRKSYIHGTHLYLGRCCCKTGGRVCALRLQSAC